MKNIFLNSILILCVLSLSNCNAQKEAIKNTYCKEEVLITYDENDGDYNTIELPKNLKDNFNWVNIKFQENFKDSVEVYFNDKIYEIKNGSLNNIFYKYDKDKRGVKLFIKSLREEGCLEILLDSKYNLVNLSKFNNQWRVEYSGYYEIIWKE